MLFENEILNISRINNVIHYHPKELSHKYPGNLPSYELTCYIKGRSKVTFNGKVINMSPGDMIYIPKGVEDDNYTVVASEPFAHYNIYFDTDSPMPKEAIHISAKPDEFKNHFEKIYRVWVGKGAGYYYKVMSDTYELFELVRKKQARYIPKNKQEFLLASEEYISNHYHDANFDYEKMVKLSGLSYSYFKKVFIDKYGCPPVKHVNNLKIQRACELIMSEKFSVSEIAEMCGFENVYYFSNVFKKYKGVSPKNYKM